MFFRWLYVLQFAKISRNKGGTVFNFPNKPIFTSTTSPALFESPYGTTTPCSNDKKCKHDPNLRSGSNARYVGVSWTSDLARRTLYNLGISKQVAPTAYANDVIGAFIAAPIVKDKLGTAGLLGPNTTFVGHSLGNMLISSAIQDHKMKVGNYVMLNPAMPCEAYDGRLPPNDPDRRNMTHPTWRGAALDGSQDYTNRVMAAGWSTLFSPLDPRSCVTWDGRFAEVLDLTKVWQFYSGPDHEINIQGEEILRPASSNVPPIGIWLQNESVMKQEWIWVFHEITKGTFDAATSVITEIPRHRNAGWGFHPRFWGKRKITPAQALQLSPESLIDNPMFYPFDRDAHKNIPYWRRNDWLNHSTTTRWLYKPDLDKDAGIRLPIIPLELNRTFYNEPEENMKIIEMEQMKVHAKLLADYIPPLSSPAGGKRLKDDTLDPDRKFNLMTKAFRNENLWDSANRPDKSERQRTLKRWLHGDYKDAPYLLTHPLYKKIKGIAQGD